MRKLISSLCLVLVSFTVAHAEAPNRPLKILFLGDNAGHQPQARFRQLEPVLAKRGIELTYTDKLDALAPKILASYDGLLIYANHTKIAPEQEKALLDYVESGKGFIPVHCASYCFLNSPKYISLVGAQFQRHDAISEFQPKIVDAQHEAMKGVEEFSAFDEPYVH